jgi:hypothetical protein
MDSMDFLDQREDEDGDVGRTMRLSTSLQNSAKQDPAGGAIKMNRTLSGESWLRGPSVEDVEDLNGC